MDRETFRQMTLDGDEKIRNTRIIWNHMNPEQQQMFLAGQKAMQDNDSVTNAFIDKLVNNYNSLQGISYGQSPQPTDKELTALGVSRPAFDRVVAYLLSPSNEGPKRSGTDSCSTGSCGCG